MQIKNAVLRPRGPCAPRLQGDLRVAFFNSAKRPDEAAPQGAWSGKASAMAVLYIPIANQPYVVGSSTYTTSSAGTVTVTDAAHIAALRSRGFIDPPAAPSVPPSGGQPTASAPATFDQA
jgi:hypothetical protein